MRIISHILVLALAAMFFGCVPSPRYTSRKVIPPQVERPLRPEKPVQPERFAQPCDESLMGMINYYMGTPYKFGGNSKSGIDCSGFVRNVFGEGLGLKLPRTVAEQWKIGKPVKKTRLKFGDVIFFRTSRKKAPSHSGIYIGGRRFAHASSSLGVTITPLSDEYWSKRYMGARRMISR